MSNSAKAKTYLSRILDDIMQTDMGILTHTSAQTPNIAKALQALNDVNKDKDRSKVKINLKEAGGKLFSTSKIKAERLENWAIKANLASSCLSLTSPNLAIGISDWVLDRLEGKDDVAQDIKILKAWAEYNLALAYKEVKSGRDQAEIELKRVLHELKGQSNDSTMQLAKDALRLPALIQLCEIHIDRQEHTRFNERKKELLQILKKKCQRQCRAGESVEKGCILLQPKNETQNGTACLYRSHREVGLHLICLEDQILSLRAQSRKVTSWKLEEITALSELLNKTILYVSKNVHLSSLQNKLYLIVLEYINEALLSVTEKKFSDSIDKENELQRIIEDLEKQWRQLVIYLQELENKPIAKRLYPERFEWWPKIFETIIKNETQDGDDNQDKMKSEIFRSLVEVLKGEPDVKTWIKSILISLLINEKPNLDAIREAINKEQMRAPDHLDSAVEEHLRNYRKVVGLFNDNFHNVLKPNEVQLIENSVCRKKAKTENRDKWLIAKLCARRRFLEGNICFKDKSKGENKCPWVSGMPIENEFLEKLDLTRLNGTVKEVFLNSKNDDGSNDPQVFGTYLDKVFENRKSEFKSRLCDHSCHKEMIGERFGLTCLRRWQSFTPALSAPQKVSRGGGYFVFKSDKNGKIEKGVVIDPGLYFLENFFEEGFSIQDIDAVLLTHHHIDHRDDLESVLTLIHEAAKKGAPKNIKLVVTRGAWPDIDAIIRRTRENIEDIYTIENGSEPGAIKELIETISIDWRNAYHDCFESDCVGYRLWLSQQGGGGKNFRFTGDTIYTPLSLQHSPGDFADRVMMLNFGGVVSDKPHFRGNAFKLEDLGESVKKKRWKEIRKWILSTGFLENHLYLSGTLQLLCDWKALIEEGGTGVAVLCELPEELSGGHRKVIAKAIQDAINSKDKEKDKEQKIVVLPEDVGLRISYAVKGDSGPKIECLYCSQLVEPAEIVVIPWGLEERLMFVCRNCKKAAEPYLLQEKFQSYKERGRPFRKAE